jgi:gamma-carbonic anhydrase
MPIYALGAIEPVIGNNCFIAPSADIIGEVSIADDVSVWFNCVLRADGNSISVGRGTNIQDGTVVHITTQLHGTSIGADVLIGHSALIHGCTLEDRSFVGFAAQVMDGCVIESEAMLGAGSLLTPGKRIPAGELWTGRPARFVRVLSQDERARNRAGVAGYAMLRDVFRKELRQIG